MRQDILFGILLTMLERKKISAKELSHKFTLSTRSIYRYIDTLCIAGVPIISTAGKYGGFSLSENYTLSSTYLTPYEFQRILAGLQTLPGVDGDVQNEILISKIKAMTKADEKDFVLQTEQLFVNTAGFSTMRSKMSVIQRSLYGQTVLKIRYHSRSGEITDRSIEPHAFLLEGGVWYVYAYCRLREKFRLFKVSRMSVLTNTEEKFERKSVETPQRNDETERNEKSEIINIGLLVSEKSKPDIEEWLGIENVTAAGKGESAKEGGFYASCSMPFDNELVSKILSFGNGVEIIAPPELKAAVRTALLQMLKIYKNDG